jgi:hypothetical protein
MMSFIASGIDWNLIWLYIENRFKKLYNKEYLMKRKIFIPVIVIVLAFTASWIFFSENLYAAQYCPGQLDCGWIPECTGTTDQNTHYCCPVTYNSLCVNNCKCYQDYRECKRNNPHIRSVTTASCSIH